MLKGYPKLNFPPIKLKARHLDDGKGLSVWSQLRSRYLALTPEEWVRRHLVEYLITHHATPPLQMVEEFPIPLNGQPQRADLVVVDRRNRPIILAECKAPDVKISRDVFAQAVRYNSVIGAQYIVLTNGVTHLCFEHIEGEYRAMESFPNVNFE